MKSILIKFLTVLCCLLCVNRAFAGDIKFVQITDSHYEVGNDYSKEVLEEAVKQVNKLKGVSFVVFTGDNINRPREENLVEFVRIVNKLNVPYYLAFGNHDVYKTAGCQKLTILKLLKTTMYFINLLVQTMLLKKWICIYSS